MDIGSKIKQSRMEASITQEQAAEALGVSRQTISNWENEKSYPDIISVLKMSDLYHVSLDYLLKGEKTMSNYVEFLDESTNVVKSKKNLSKMMILLAYLVIWSVTVLVFWCYAAKADALGYAMLYMWLVLPITTFTLSYMIGKNNHWEKKKWFFSLGFGIMYMLASYATFSLANTIQFQHWNDPDWSMVIVGTLVSLLGMGIGYFNYRRQQKKDANEQKA